MNGEWRLVKEVGMKKVDARPNERCFCEERFHKRPHLSPFTFHLSHPRSGFTLLEVLVASVLMGMLVTILTMIFNQSAIAWRTGKASVADMSETERNLARIHAMADNVLPYTGGQNYCVVSPWDDAKDDSSTRFNPRGIRRVQDLRTGVATIGGNFYNQDAGKGDWKKSDLGNPDLNGGKTFIVGVRSAGPDRQWETEDDISTWPDEVE